MSPLRKPAVVLSLLLLVAGPLAFGPGCGGVAAEPASPVLVIGIDGLEWSVLRPLMQAGRCPNLRALMERGVFGRLATMVPTQSPIIWTTIATGKLPKQHKVFGFIDGKGRPYTSSRRGGRALWNIADEYGLTSNVVGWWITWPVETIRGVMVSGSSSAALIADNWKPTLLPDVPDQVHPASLTDAIMADAAHYGALERTNALAVERIFGPGTKSLVGPVENKLIDQTLWSVQSDETFAEVATKVFAEHPADLNMVYLGGTDVSAHRFWRHYRPGDFTWKGSDAADAALHCVIPNYYEWIDEKVGKLVASVSDDTTVLVVADHGMTANKHFRDRAPDLTREQYVTGHHHDGEPGVIIAAGPGAATGGDVTAFLGGAPPPVLGRVTNVAPTVLALLGIPGAKDMVDRAHKPLLAGEALRHAALPAVTSHDTGFREPGMKLMDADMEKAFSDRFRALGYLELEGAEGGAELVHPDALDGGSAPAPEPGGGPRPDSGSCAVTAPR